MQNSRTQLRRAILAFEQSTRLNVTVHDISGRVSRYLTPGRTTHRTPCCIAAKADRGVEACTRFDQRQVREVVGGRRSAFSKICHAGLVEWVTAIVVEDQPLAVLFAGQRRPMSGFTPLLIDPELTPATGKRPQGIAGVDPAAAQLNSDLLEQLAARMGQCLHAIERQLRPGIDPDQSFDASTDRLARIHSYIEHNHTQSATLTDLAEQLHLSATRTGHLVVELAGQSFKQLLTEARLNTAAALLQHTDLAIDEVGRRAGLPNASHFHRVFRREQGMTPHQFRKSAV